MNKRATIFFWVLISLLLTGSVSLTFYRYVILRDYMVTAHRKCDPQTDVCFYVSCEGVDCPTQIDYYDKIHKKAFNIESCDPNAIGCNSLVCKTGEKDCEVISCSSSTVSDGEACSTPLALPATTTATST